MFTIYLYFLKKVWITLDTWESIYYTIIIEQKTRERSDETPRQTGLSHFDETEKVGDSA